MDLLHSATVFASATGFDWGEVHTYLFDPIIVQGAIITIILAVISQLTGTVLGLLLYLLRRSRNIVAHSFAEVYIWIFRGTPLLVQLLILWGVFAEFQLLRTVRSVDFFASLGFERIKLEAFLPAFIALGLNEGAYMSEIVRAGIDSIDVGQMEAAKSLGMSYGQAMRRIIIPQAARVIVPPLGNEFNSMLKTTSLASTIGLIELYKAADGYGLTDFKPIELGIVASIWYLGMTSIWGFVQSWIERKLNASNLDGPRSVSFLDRLMGRANDNPQEVASEAILSGGRR